MDTQAVARVQAKLVERKRELLELVGPLPFWNRVVPMSGLRKLKRLISLRDCKRWMIESGRSCWMSKEP